MMEKKLDRLQESKQEKKQDLTELVFILDRSGSMAGLEKDTVGGFNAMLEKQKKQSGKCYVSTVLFGSDCRVLHDRIELERVEALTDEDYTVGGCTALLDAVGGAIHHIGNVHRYARPEDVPARTLFVITTDGMENASHRYTYQDVQRMIERQKGKYGWEFLFLGANMDAADTAGRMGISRDRAAQYRSDEQGTRLNYDVLSDAISRVRCQQAVAPGWADRIDADVKKRGGR